MQGIKLRLIKFKGKTFIPELSLFPHSKTLKIFIPYKEPQDPVVMARAKPLQRNNSHNGAELVLLSKLRQDPHSDSISAFVCPSCH